MPDKDWRGSREKIQHLREVEHKKARQAGATTLTDRQIRKKAEDEAKRAIFRAGKESGDW